MNSGVLNSNNSTPCQIATKNILRDSTNKADNSRGSTNQSIVKKKIKANNGSHSLSSFNKFGNSEVFNIQNNSNNSSQVTFNEVVKSRQESQVQGLGIGQNMLRSNEFVIPHLEPKALEPRMQTNLLLIQNPKDLEPITESENQNPDIQIKRLLRWGNNKLLLGKYKKAKEDYQKILSARPNCFEALYNCGIAWYCHDNREKALECFNRASQIEPHNGNIHLLLAQVYERLKDDEMAAKCYQKAIDEDHFNGVAFVLYGNFMAVNRRRYRKAIAKYRKAFRAASQTELPSSVDLGMMKDWKEIEPPNVKGLDDEVSIICEQSEDSILKLNTTSAHIPLSNMSAKDVDVAAVALLNMAQVSAKKKFMVWAFLLYQKVLVKFGKYEKYKRAAYAGLAKWYTAQKQYDRAVEMYSRVFPTHTPSAKKQKTKADELMENRPLSKLEGKKGNDFIRNKDYDAAKEAYEKSYEMNKNGYLANFHLAKINIIQGRKEEAKKFLEKAHNILPYACKNLKLKTVAIDCQLKTL